MKTNHTPGPWELERSGTKQFIVGFTPLIGGRRLNTICTLPANNEQRDANARLIAAAPELLDVAQKTLIFFESFKPSFPASTPMGAIIEGNIEMLRETIAKAAQQP